MKIGIDARLYGEKNTGLGIYIEKLIENLQKIDKKNNYYIFLLKNNYNLLKIKNKNFKKIKVNIKWYTVKEHLLFPFLLYRYKLDLIHFPHFNVPFLYFKKHITTIHDLTPIYFPPKNLFRKIGLYLVFLKSVYFSNKIITVSKTIKNEIIKKFKLKDKKIIVIYQGIRDFPKLKKKEEDFLKKKWKIRKPYLLYCGHWRIHKNIKNLLIAFEILSNKNIKIKLYLTGKPKIKNKKILYLLDKLKKKKVIKILGFLNTKELGFFIKNSEGIILPSYSEGFGLPPLEALKFKKIPYVSNIEIFKEVLGNLKISFKPSNPIDIAEKIIFGLKDKILKNRIKKRAKKLLERYDYKNMTIRTLKQYERIYHKKNI